MISFVLIITILAICSCGYVHGPGFSMKDRDYFMESPKLVKSGDAYKLVWRYGNYGFYFSPKCIVGKSELLCSLQGTSSSGSLTGKYGEISITRPEEIKAINFNKAFWLEPDGTRIKIEIGNA